MSVAERNVVTIEKEQVGSLRFPAGEVLKSSDEIKSRRAQLERAQTLGNLEKGKVRIVFEDSEGLKMVHTTIWSVTDNRVVLKGDMSLPLNRIWQVHA